MFGVYSLLVVAGSLDTRRQSQTACLLCFNTVSTKMKFVALLCMLAAAVHARPNGAPGGACPNIYPVGHTDPSNSITDPTGGPFQLDISNFTMCTGAGSAPGYCYYPGETYYLTLSGMNNDDFRGLLVQGRQAADGTTPTGTFINFNSNTQAAPCMPAMSAVTHTNPSVKRSVLLHWTAPAVGTGPVRFHFAVVVTYQPRAPTSNEFYATLVTAPIAEVPTTGTTPTATTGTTPTAGASTSLSGVSSWAILAIAIITAAKMVA